jgi:hypothetical protein
LARQATDGSRKSLVRRVEWSLPEVVERGQRRSLQLLGGVDKRAAPELDARE